jgi:hypothetical protein
MVVVPRYRIIASAGSELARFAGTSVEQIDRTYGHLLPDSIDRTKAALDALVERMGTDRALETEASE